MKTAMKTHTIKTPTAELMILELPKEAFNAYSIYVREDDETSICYRWNSDVNDLRVFKIKGSYTLLGKPDEIREEDAMEVVHEVEGYNPVLKKFHKAYRLYNGRIIRATHTAKQSLLSLLESEIFWDVNPEGRFPRYAFDENINPKDIKARAYHQKWYEAEQKTFDRNRTIIFKKNK